MRIIKALASMSLLAIVVTAMPTTSNAESDAIKNASKVIQSNLEQAKEEADMEVETMTPVIAAKKEAFANDPDRKAKQQENTVKIFKFAKEMRKKRPGRCI